MKEILDIYIQHAQSFLTNPLLVVVGVAYLFLVARVDSKTMKIPNKLNLIFFLLGLLIISINGYINQNLISSLTTAFSGAIIGFLAFFIPAFALNTPMGGDIKCFTTLGLFFGPRLLIVFGTILCITVLIVKLGKILLSKENIFYKQVQYNCIKREKFPLGPWFFRSYLLLLLLGGLSTYI